MNAGHGLVNRLEDLLAVVHANDRDQLVSWLLTHGGAEPATIGASMFEAAQQAMAVEDFVAARAILHHLLEVTADAESRERLQQFIGDLYLAEGNRKKARECYHQLTGSERGLARYLYTFVQDNDLRELFFERDRLAGVIQEQRLRNYLEEIVTQCVSRIVNQTQIGSERLPALRRNLEYLQRIDPPMAERLLGLGDLEPHAERILPLDGVVYLFQGNRWVRERDERPEKERMTRADLAVTDPRFAMLVCCSCLGSFLELIAALRTDEPEFHKDQLLVLIDSKLLASFLAVADLEPLVSCDFVIRFIDEADIEQHLPEVMLNNNVLSPSKFVHPLPEDERFIRERVFPLFRAIKEEVGRKIARYAKMLTSRYPADFSRTIPGKVRDKSLRVLLLVSRYTTYLQYCVRDLAAGLRELGYEAEIMMEEEHDPARLRDDIQLQRFCEFLPDIIICINHLRYELPWVPKEVPFVTWIQDPAPGIFQVDLEDGLGELDYIYCTAAYFQKLLQGRVPAAYRNEVGILPFLLNPEYYYPIPGCEKKHQLSYVGHLDLPKPLLEALETCPDALLSPEAYLHRRLLRRMETLSFQELNRLYVACDSLGRSFLAEVYRACGVVDAPITDDKLFYFRDRLLHTVIRMKPIAVLVQHGIPVSLFGMGWGEHPLFRPFAKGPVQNGAALNQVLNETAINLNISPFMSFHNKVPEVAGARAFFLSRDIGPDDLMPLGHYFKPDEEVVLFDSEEELVRKVGFYLEHPEIREAIAQRAHQKIMDEYTFAAGAARVLEDIARNLEGMR